MPQSARRQCRVGTVVGQVGESHYHQRMGGGEGVGGVGQFGLRLGGGESGRMGSPWPSSDPAGRQRSDLWGLSGSTICG
jgi:hypothetical protein